MNWLHIQHDKCTWRNRLKNWHCPVKQDQWDCVLNDLEELGGDEFLLKNQCSNGIVNISQDCLWFSRIQSPHHCLEVDYMTKMIDQFLRHWKVGGRIILWFNTGPSSVPKGTVFELTEVRLCGFALAFNRLARANTFVLNANTSNFISEISCSLSSSSLLLKSMANLIKPWEILTHEWELSLYADSILSSTPCLPSV